MKNKGFIHILIIGLVLILIVFVRIFFYLKFKALYQFQETPSPTPIMVSSETPNPSSKASVTGDWKTYEDKEFNFNFKYPSDLFLLEKEANIVILQNQPPPELFGYSNMTRPYKRQGFQFEIIPGTNSKPALTKGYFDKEMYSRYENRIENVLILSIDGVESYKYLLKGEQNLGDYILQIPYSEEKSLQIKFLSSFKQSSQDIKTAYEVSDQILSTFKFLD